MEIQIHQKRGQIFRKGISELNEMKIKKVRVRNYGFTQKNFYKSLYASTQGNILTRSDGLHNCLVQFVETFLCALGT